MVAIILISNLQEAFARARARTLVTATFNGQARLRDVVAVLQETSNSVRIYYAIRRRPWLRLARPGRAEVLPTYVTSL